MGTLFLSGCSNISEEATSGQSNGNSPVSESTSDQRGEYIYRVVNDPHDGIVRITDRKENMHKYPEGVDFKTPDEASEYIRKLNRGSAEYL